MAIASCSDNAAIVDNYVVRNTVAGTWRVILKMQPKPGNHDPVDLRCTLQKGDEDRRAKPGPINGVRHEYRILTDESGGWPGGRWKNGTRAYAKVESYFHALRIRNKPLLGQLVLRVLERAQRRAPAEPQRSATELAAEEMDGS